MEILKIKGHSVNFIPTKASHNRRAVQYQNKIIDALTKLGTKRDDIDLEFEGFCGKEAKAIITWYFNGHRMYYEIATKRSYVDNLFIILKIIENEVNLVLNETKPIEEFLAEFEEDEDVHDERKVAREFFELKDDHRDLNEIDKKYKRLAQTLHPDMPTGDVEKFKQLNYHHKILKRELA
jgi:hypothetical protein